MTSAGSKHCPNCQAEYGAWSTVCLDCGTALDGEEERASLEALAAILVRVDDLEGAREILGIAF